MIKFIFLFITILTSRNILAAGPLIPNFNYEVFEHQSVPALAVGANNASINYLYPMIALRNLAIPALNFVAPALTVEFSVRAGAGFVHNPFNVGAGALTLAEACQMAIQRQGIGIVVRFQHPALIAAIAAGAPILPANMLYLNRALGGGGYLSPLASALYKFRNFIPFPVFVLPAPGAANEVVIHIHDQIRVSKNLKELSHNSLILPAGGIYQSLKNMINAQYVAAGFPLPNSATIVSSDFVQPQ